MKLTKCASGHFYDADKYPECPYCNTGLQTDSSIVRSGAAEESPEETPVEPAVPAAAPAGPVAGWLVVLDGEAKGRDLRLGVGRTFLGLDKDGTPVTLSADAPLSLRQAVLVYDGEAKTYTLLPGSSQELCYLGDTALLEPDTKVILVKDGMVAVPRGQGAIADYANVHMRLAQLPGAYVAAELHTHPTALAIFLGSYGGKRDEHVVAVDVSRMKAAETVVASSEHMGADDAFGEQHEPEAKTSKSLLESAAERFDWVDLRGFAPHASAREAGQATTAISLGVWHARQRHCPTCGAPTEPALGGWAQRCTSEADGKRLLFPRVEPAVITAIVDH